MEVKSLGNIYKDNWGTGFPGNVWDKNMLSPTLTTMQGGGREPMIIENVIIGGMQEHQSIKEDGVCTCLTSSMGTGGGYAPMRIDQMCISTKGKENEVASTILAGYERTNMTGFNADNAVVETEIQKVGQISNDGSQYGTVVSDNGLAPNLCAGTHGYANSCIQTQYRIRKLTPLECWRLMDFTDEDFEKAAKVNSNTQLYKQAGNSIVKNVLVAIMGQLLPGKEDVYKEISNET